MHDNLQFRQTMARAKGNNDATVTELLPWGSISKRPKLGRPFAHTIKQNSPRRCPNAADDNRSGRDYFSSEKLRQMARIGLVHIERDGHDAFRSLGSLW